MTRPASPSGRYQRHQIIDGFSQSKVSRLRVLVVGAGAIGNEVIKNLSLLGVGQIVVYDIDRVEIHNLTRSVLLRESDVGKSKAHCVSARAQELNPSLDVSAIGGDIRTTLTLDDVTQADLVFCCVDNFEARIRVNQICRLTHTSWVNTGIDSRYASVESYPNGSAQNTPACFECQLPDSVYQRLAERQSCGGLLRAASAQKTVPTTTITTSIAAALAAQAGLQLSASDQRHGAQARLRHSLREFVDTLGVSSRQTIIEPAQLCAGCEPSQPTLDRLTTADSADELLRRLQQHEPGAAQSGLLDRIVELSDAIIWSCQCSQCGPQSSTSAFEGKIAAMVSDAISICPQCQQSSVAIVIRQRFELQELLARFGNQPIPGRWAILQNTLIGLH